MSIKNSSVCTELFARDNCEPRSDNAKRPTVGTQGGKFRILEGPEKFHRFVVIEFPSFEKAVACHESAEDLEAAAHRRKDGASELEIVIVESI